MNKTVITILVLITLFVLTYFAFVFFESKPQSLQPNTDVLSQSPSTSPTIAYSKFVTEKGQDLYYQGKIYRSVGVNRYNLLTQSVNGVALGCANTFSEGEIDTTFSELHDIGVTSIRFWLFQSFTKSGQDTSRFDYVLSEANKYDIKVIPVFENHWADCTEGGVKSPSWYTSGYTSPYGGYSLSLRDYIGKIVPKYKDNPTILTWEIMNEASSTDIQGLYNFTTDVSSYVKSLDPNHLVSMSLGDKQESKSIYQELSSISSLDMLAYHDYDEETNALPDNLRDAMTVAKEDAKPSVVGESGISQTVSNRDDLFASKMQAFFANGGSMYLLWAYGDPYVTDDGFNFTSTNQLAQIVKQVSEKIQN